LTGNSKKSIPPIAIPKFKRKTLRVFFYFRKKMKILGICGSLRKESYNLKILEAFSGLLEKPNAMEIVLLHDIPLYNNDVEKVGFPDAVQALGKKIRDASCIVFGCPEYNYSVTGVLKNAIDWVSRLPDRPFAGKIAGIIGASPGLFGSARAQYHLRQMGVFLDLQFINQPEVMLGAAHTKFGPDGALLDEFTIKLLKKLESVLVEKVPNL
jgi:chromate reductase